MPANIIKQFLRLESLSGIILFVAAILAVAWANSPWRDLYISFTNENLRFFINEGLMAFFFLLVGLELKRSYCEGKFSSLEQIILPLAAAIGGMLLPAGIYVGLNYTQPDLLKGWAIPVATDIAFAIGLLSLFGRRVPLALKLFLLALAIFDDIGAIVIIAIFYSHNTSIGALLIAAVLLLVLFILNRLDRCQLSIYLLLGLALWYALFKAGVHPTIAGVLLAMMIPYHDEQIEVKSSQKSPLHRLEEGLHPYVAYFIIPFFALLNSGFSFERITPQVLTSGIVLGSAIGLFLGKQIGVLCSAWLLIRIKYAQLPQNTSWLALYGVALLCGIGFTMSLFIGTLSFQNESLHLAEVRLGVIAGSILSGIFGVLVLSIAFPRLNAQEDSVE